LARINFARFPFKFPAYFWDIVSRRYTEFTFTFPAYFCGPGDVDPGDVDPSQLTIFTFTFPAYFYEVPV